MEKEMEMEAATKEVSPSTSPVKRLGIKNTIQTNFGVDYVFQIATNPEISNLAVSLSSNIVKFYSTSTGQYIGECKGHGGSIHEVSFDVPSSPHVLCSCSSDGTIRAWDIRSFQQVSVLKVGSSQEVFSFSFGGSNSNLIAGGSNALIYFWDWRLGKQVACLEESHTDDVTKVRFVPNQQHKLISSSMDGLMCLFDTSTQIDDEEYLETVMNVETSITNMGFFGQSNEKLWCLTHIETLSIWDWRDGRREVNFEDARSLASERWNRDHLDYFVDCQYSGDDDRLCLIGGTSSGTLGYFPVNYGPLGSIGPSEAILEGGHSGVVRTILSSSRPRGVHAQKMPFCWTGGEDGRLCCWLSDESCEVNRSWISSSFVMKSHNSRNKSRHQPY